MNITRLDTEPKLRHIWLCHQYVRSRAKWTLNGFECVIFHGKTNENRVLLHWEQNANTESICVSVQLQGIAKYVQSNADAIMQRNGKYTENKEKKPLTKEQQCQRICKQKSNRKKKQWRKRKTRHINNILTWENSAVDCNQIVASMFWLFSAESHWHWSMKFRKCRRTECASGACLSQNFEGENCVLNIAAKK